MQSIQKAKKRFTSFIITLCAISFCFSLSSGFCVEEEEDLYRDLFKESFCARADITLDRSFDAAVLSEDSRIFLQDLFWRLRYVPQVEVLSFDHEIRPHFQPLQTVLEKVIADLFNREIYNLSIFIHTNNLSEDLNKPFQEEESSSLIDFLSRGANLYILHPSTSNTREHPHVERIPFASIEGASYVKVDLVCSSIPSHIEGVTYTFSTNTGERYLCGMRTKTEGSSYAVIAFDLFFSKETENPSHLTEIEELISQEL